MKANRDFLLIILEQIFEHIDNQLQSHKTISV